MFLHFTSCPSHSRSGGRSQSSGCSLQARQHSTAASATARHTQEVFACGAPARHAEFWAVICVLSSALQYPSNSSRICCLCCPCSLVKASAVVMSHVQQHSHEQSCSRTGVATAYRHNRHSHRHRRACCNRHSLQDTMQTAILHANPPVQWKSHPKFNTGSTAGLLHVAVVSLTHAALALQLRPLQETFLTRTPHCVLQSMAALRSCAVMPYCTCYTVA
jgi:hypothetical protein